MKKFSYNQEALDNLGIKDTSILDPLVDFESARRAHQKKDHSRHDKRMSIKEAVAEFVAPNDIMTDGCFSYVRTPIQAFFEICRQYRDKNMNLQHISSPNTNMSYFINYGVTKYVHNSYAGAEMRGIDRSFNRRIKNGDVTILSEWSHGAMAQGFKAAQLGCPGVFSKQLLGSDIVGYNPFVKVMQNPACDEPDKVVYIPALYPDLTIIHAQWADKYGNVRIFGPAVNDVAMAAAARKVIITAEEIVPEAELRNNSKGVIIPFMYVDAVVEMPYGGLPGNVPGYYYWSREWWEWLFRIALLSDEACDDFFAYWVDDCKDQYDFLEKLGGGKWLANARRLVKAGEGDNELDGVSYDYQEVVAKFE